MTDTNPKPTYDFSSFKLAMENMSQKKNSNSNSSFNFWGYRQSSIYTIDEVEKILTNGSPERKKELSFSFFESDGFYKNLITYYATLLTYQGLIIPNPSPGRKLSEKSLKKQYLAAVDFIENFPFKTFFTNVAQKVLVEGSYYGLIQEATKTKLSILDLPASHCRSNSKNLQEQDRIELNLAYFNTLNNETEQKNTLNLYPKYIRQAYYRFVKKGGPQWIFIPVKDSIYFNFFDEIPFFLHTILPIYKYHDAVETDRLRELEEVKKIIVQQVPHLPNGDLLFSPPEVEVMHNATVGMLQNNPHVSVLTSYNEVEAITSKTTSDVRNNSLEKMLNNIYSEAGVSSHVFASTGSSTLNTSIKNDMAFMMVLGNKFSNFLSLLLNTLFQTQTISFQYQIFPLSIYTANEFVDSALKMASQGYSFIVPSLGMGISQRNLENLKELENDVLELDKKLLPLSSSHTQSAGGGTPGRPTLPQEDKSPKTLQNEQSQDNTAGGSNL